MQKCYPFLELAVQIHHSQQFKYNQNEKIFQNFYRGTPYYIQKRQKLINFVIQGKKGILSASRILKINPATAKNIIMVFRKSGKILQKKLKNKSKKIQNSKEQLKIKMNEKQQILSSSINSYQNQLAQKQNMQFLDGYQKQWQHMMYWYNQAYIWNMIYNYNFTGCFLQK